MQAMLLAAGMGSRLGKLTDSTPKCLVTVADRPILEWNILKLKQAGISRIVINLYHLSELVRSFVEDNQKFGLDIVFSEEPELYNTGGGIKAAQHLFAPSLPVLVTNADVLSSIDLRLLYEHHLSEKNAATLATITPNDPRVLLFGEENKQLQGWRNNASGEERLLNDEVSLVERGFCGIQVISPVIFEHLGRPQEKLSSIRGYLSAVSAGENVREYEVKEQDWFDIGTPEQLESCRQYFKNREILKI